MEEFGLNGLVLRLVEQQSIVQGGRNQRQKTSGRLVFRAQKRAVERKKREAIQETLRRKNELPLARDQTGSRKAEGSLRDSQPPALAAAGRQRPGGEAGFGGGSRIPC